MQSGLRVLPTAESGTAEPCWLQFKPVDQTDSNQLVEQIKSDCWLALAASRDEPIAAAEVELCDAGESSQLD